MTQRPPSSRPGHDRAAAENRRKNRSKSGILLFHPRICRANPSRRGRIPTGLSRESEQRQNPPISCSRARCSRRTVEPYTDRNAGRKGLAATNESRHKKRPTDEDSADKSYRQENYGIYVPAGIPATLSSCSHGSKEPSVRPVMQTQHVVKPLLQQPVKQLVKICRLALETPDDLSLGGYNYLEGVGRHTIADLCRPVG